MSNTNTFLQFLNELKTLENQIAGLEAERDAIRDLIKDGLTAAELEELHIGNFKLTYRTTISKHYYATAYHEMGQ